ncbi:hypothetical protein JOL79_16770 [Microbispora sp. RL4-1S]|uniref:Circularly permuted type 2 ATP-grasp protein n=1 Tax=Microbispora oryzae TaxID=2806554 RepID=A0A940WH70_9ACTN|nr:hypothetical protein [Microbispora oryzae]MBP2705466.1 hypothetical protein [Microbispora oryzae]
MIAWPEAMAEAHRLIADPAATDRAVSEAVAAAPAFQNRDFPLSPLPLLVRHEEAEPLRDDLAGYVALLGEVVRLYREHEEVQAWFGLGAGAHRLVMADAGPGDRPWVCRLDGYVEQETERLVILENNADAPAGTLFTARINDLVAGLSSGRGRLTSLTYRGGDLFLRALLEGARLAARADPGRCGEPGALAILQPAGAANRESAEMVSEFNARGIDAFLADPRELTVVRGRARFGDRGADLCWNKVNTVAWTGMMADAEFAKAWEAALLETPLVHLNPFGARYVAESKLALAFVQEPGFASLFTAEQRRLADRLLPWTRRVTSGELVERLLDDQRSYVVKQPYDIRGDGVTIGHDVPRAAWRQAVGQALREGHVAQRLVAPAAYPVITPGSDRVSMMAFSLDTYVLGGQVAGFGSKASHNARVNIFQGGRKLAVHVLTRDRV